MKPSSFLFAAGLIGLATAQQPEQVHLAMTGNLGELSIDFMSHENCSFSYGAQIDVTPDFSSADFIPVYNCSDFSSQESLPTYTNQVLLKNLKVGTKYYYVVGAEGSRDPWSQVMSFTYGSGAVRPGGAKYAVLADFGYFNAESLEMLISDCYEGKFDALLHAGDFALSTTFPSSSFSTPFISNFLYTYLIPIFLLIPFLPITVMTLTVKRVPLVMATFVN